MEYKSRVNLVGEFLENFNEPLINSRISIEDWEEWSNNQITKEFFSFLAQIRIQKWKDIANLNSNNEDLFKNYHHLRGAHEVIGEIIEKINEFTAKEENIDEENSNRQSSWDANISQKATLGRY